MLPILKEEKEGEEKRQYVIVSEVESRVREKGTRNEYGCSQYFCFLTSCTLFQDYKQISQQILNYTFQEARKGGGLAEVVRLKVESTLEQLLGKSLEENQYANFQINSVVSLFIDVPTRENMYRAVCHFRPW